MLSTTILEEQAGDLLAAHSPATRLGLGQTQSSMHIYPTMFEATRYLAREGRCSRLLALLERFHRRAGA